MVALSTTATTTVTTSLLDEGAKTDGSTVPHLVVPYTLDTNDMRFALPQGFSHAGPFFEYLRDSFARCTPRATTRRRC